MPRAAQKSIGRVPQSKGRSAKQEKQWVSRAANLVAKQQAVEEAASVSQPPSLSAGINASLASAITGAKGASQAIAQAARQRAVKLAPAGGVELSPDTIRELEEKGYRPAKLGNSQYFEVPQFIYDKMLSKINNKQKRRRARRDAHKSRRHQAVGARA